MDVRKVSNSLERIFNYLRETKADVDTMDAFSDLRNEITKGILFIMQIMERVDRE